MADPLYGEALAAIQVAAFGDAARGAVPGLLSELRAAGHRAGRVVDLGCGGGDWLAALDAAGYDAVGYEPSPHLAAHARRLAPGARVFEGGVEDASLDGAVAVTALGEVFNYLVPGVRTPPLARRFARIGRALPRGGLLAFDLIVAGAPAMRYRTWNEGPGWLLAVELREWPARGLAERSIRIFRRGEDRIWQDGLERHRIRVPSRSAVVAALRDAGFSVRTRRCWGDHPLAPRRLAFLARKR